MVAGPCRLHDLEVVLHAVAVQALAALGALPLPQLPQSLEDGGTRAVLLGAGAGAALAAEAYTRPLFSST